MPADAPSLALAAFGKHPGWNDHLDDLGMDTPWLVALKRKLYFDGVAANIDAGTWEKLRDDQRVPEFSHEFLWRANGTLTLGRMWSSKDGKGRGRYPMVVCAQSRRVPAVWLFDKVRGQLEELERHFRQAETAAEVVSQLDLVRGRLRRTLELARTTGEDYSAWLRDATAFGPLLQHPALGPGHTGLHRVLYKLEREAPGWMAGARSGVEPDVLTLRVPAVADLPTGALLLWHGILLKALQPTVPFLLLRHADSASLDVLAGRPSTTSFFCLRANDAALPRSTDVPYQLEPAALQRLEAWIDTLARGDGPILAALLDTGRDAGDLNPAAPGKKGLLSGIKSLWGGN